MKRLGLFIYAVALWFIGIVGLLPMTVIFRVCTKEYSSARIWAIENTLKFIYEYRYRVLQLTNKKDGIGYYGIINIDSTMSMLEEYLYENKQGRELGYI